MIFRDRADAGRRLGEVLSRESWDAPLVLAIPRGGVPVAAEVARALDAPLDVFVSRKVGVPEESEVGMAAVAEGGSIWIDRPLVRQAGVGEDALAAAIAAEREEVDRCARLYRSGRPTPDVAGRTVILVDDGIARGGTARAALRSLRALRPGRLVLAAPVIAGETAPSLLDDAEVVLCVAAPTPFVAVGLWYEAFSPVMDEEVLEILARVRVRTGPSPQPSPPAGAGGEGDNERTTTDPMDRPRT
jgi:putative phosphoribosyl transferase